MLSCCRARVEDEDPGRVAPTPPVSTSRSVARSVPRSTTPSTAVTSIGVRREIREMSPSDAGRFVDALDRMMDNGEYFRIAGYHGWPGDHCAHAQEVFPGWHRAYCLEFEHALRAADRANGNDGTITLPYWDTSRPSVNGQVFPRVFRERYGDLRASLRQQLEGQPGGSAFAAVGYSRIYTDERIADGLQGLASRWQLSLLAREHWMHASTRFSRGGEVSIEDPHNAGHVAIGFPMTSVRFAAFHPIFFLHHANVDRVYDKYLLLEPDSQEEFAAQQRKLALEDGETNRFTAPLDPFRHPATGEVMLPQDTFSSRALGYMYDRLPADPPQALMIRERPTLAVFPGVTKTVLNFRSFQLHVFVAAAADGAHSVPAPAKGSDAETSVWRRHPSYGGLGSVFGGKGAECANCLDMKPIDVTVDVSAALRRQRLGRDEAALHVVCVDEHGYVVPLAETGLPEPRILGTLFEGSETLQRGDRGHDVRAAKRRLGEIGFDSGDASSPVFDKELEDALLRYAKHVGLVADGRLTSAVRQSLRRVRFDQEQDVAPASADTQRMMPACVRGTPLHRAGAINYYVGISPGYLSRTAVVFEVDTAFALWARASGVDFCRTNAPGEALATVQWADRSRESDLVFDGPGGALAHTDGFHVSLDVAERWLVQGMEERPGQFQLLPVLLHEIGHLLGLSHDSPTADAVMAPFYDAKRTSLADADVKRVQALYAE